MKKTTGNKREKELREYWRLFGRLLIVTGIFVVLATAIIYAVDWQRSIHVKELFAQEKSENQFGISDAFDTSTDENSQTAGSLQDISLDVDKEEKEILGILRVSSINLEEGIQEGESKNVLSSALGHLTDTAMPGEAGNCAIAGHRNYVFGRFFNRLNELTVGDSIEIETLEGTYVYTVTESFVVEPDEISVLEQTEVPELTLITCTPIFIGTHRLIIRAVLTAQTPYLLLSTQ